MNFLLAFESWEKWCVSNIFSIHIRRKRTSLLFTDISDTYSRHMHWMSLKVSLRVSEIMSHSGEAFSVFPVSLQNTGLICFSEWVQRPVVVLANALAVRHRCVHVDVWSTPHEIAGRRYVIIQWKSFCCRVQEEMSLVCRKQEKHLRKWLRMVQKQRHLNLKVAWPSKWKKNRFRPLNLKSLVRACKAM